MAEGDPAGGNGTQRQVEQEAILGEAGARAQEAAAIFECAGLLYEVPDGAAGHEVAREIMTHHGYGGYGDLVDSGDDSDSDGRDVRRWTGVGLNGDEA